MSESIEYVYAKISEIDTPAQGVLNQAKEYKARAWKRLQSIRARVKASHLHADRLALIKAESAHKEALQMERDAKRQIERRANELGKTIYKSSSSNRGPLNYRKAKATIQIVLAWADMTGMEATGRQILKDMNYFPEFKPCVKAHSAMWLRRGTEKDIEKAEKHLDTIKGDYLTARVFVYPREEKQPLERARIEIMNYLKEEA